eukprot:c30831_g1_i1 orf=1-180(-)
MMLGVPVFILGGALSLLLGLIPLPQECIHMQQSLKNFVTTYAPECTLQHVSKGRTYRNRD